MRKWLMLIAVLVFPGNALAQTESNAGAFVQNAFNPDISIIIDAAAVRVDRPDEAAGVLAVPGYLEESNREGKARGFNFNYFEISFKSTVDPYFDFFGVATFEGEGVDVEEAYVDTRQLPWGLGLRAGKLMSAFGRLNGMHKHYWDFYDAPLVYEVFTGGEGIKNPGLRLTWTAPLEFLLQLNAEVFQGAFEDSPTFGIEGYELTAVDGTRLQSGAASVPGLYAGTLKTSFDFGQNVLLLGASCMAGHTRLLQIEGAPSDSAFDAAATLLYDFEFTYKYLLSSYRSLAWQSEYLGRVSSGKLALASDGLRHDLDQRQGGFYSQFVWRFDNPGRWRTGLRYDLLVRNELRLDDVEQKPAAMLPRYTAMLEFSPTEFSRLRLQYAYDRSRFDESVRKDVQEVLLQATFAVGPHGAHSF